MNKYLFIYL